MEDALRLDTLYGRALRSAAWVNCNSHAVHGDLCARIPEIRQRSSVTYYGMDPPALQPSPRPHIDPVVLGFGRLVRDKGFDLAVHAFERVLRRFPRARLVLAGEGAARPELERLVEELGVAGSIQFVGPVPPQEVPALINSASLVVVPSRWNEPFGLVALEAALMARPVVAARVGGLAEVVEHGQTGLLVERENYVALADAVLYLLSNFAIADQMGATARVRALERFSWNRCVDEYERLYELTCHFNRSMERLHD
jgi:glycogen(starch) synthase